MTPSPDDPILAEVTRRLAEACHPDRIYLFGSAARGDAGPHSDYDFLLVVPDDAPEDVLSGRRGYDAIHDLRLYADVVVEPRSYFAGRLHLKASMPATVVREGKLLYGNPNGRIDMAIEPADKNRETAEWLAAANEDLLSAIELLRAQPPRVKTALYHCQQVAEKGLKTFLFWHDIPFQKVHEIKALGEQCAAIDASLEPLILRAQALSAYAHLFRYPGATYVPTIEEARQGLALAREVYEAVVARVPGEARP